VSEKKKKDKVVSFRLSEKDFSQFEKKLASSCMNQSEFFREVFLHSNIQLTVKSAPSKNLERLTFLFNKSSHHLNQIAHQLNQAHLMGKIPLSFYSSLNNALISIRDLLITEIKDVD